MADLSITYLAAMSAEVSRNGGNPFVVRVVKEQHDNILAFRLTWGNIDVVIFQKGIMDRYTDCRTGRAREPLLSSCQKTADTGAYECPNIGHHARRKNKQTGG